MRWSVILLWLIGLACAPHPALAPAPAAVTDPPPHAVPARPPDRDGDGIPDDKDQCPDAPETVNGCRDEDGCPDRTVVQPPRWRAEILDRVFFTAGSAKIRSAEPLRGDLLVDAVAAALKMHPDLGPIEVRGHAAPHERQPARLAEARAVAVLEGLVARGVPRERLAARGLGATLPACTSRNEECWSQSRRVEFSFLRQPPLPPTEPVGPHDCLTVLL